jgi:hypothetical protein
MRRRRRRRRRKRRRRRRRRRRSTFLCFFIHIFTTIYLPALQNDITSDLI